MTGRPWATAQRQASSEPREPGELKKTTRPRSADRTTVRVRAARRTGKGRDGEPPAHHWTEPPHSANEETAATAEAGPQPAPPGPNAARHWTKDGGITPGTADKTAASAPEQQPTTNEPPAPAISDATRATSSGPDAGSTREPATA